MNQHMPNDTRHLQSQSENVHPDYLRQMPTQNESYTYNPPEEQNLEDQDQEDSNVSFGGEPEVTQGAELQQNNPSGYPPQEDYDFSAKVNQDKLAPVGNQDDRRSQRSFAEEVESQNSVNEFKAGKRSRTGSIAADVLLDVDAE